MTAQTVAYLKASEFTLTGSPGRIVPQHVVDLLDTLVVRSSATINVKSPEYGAIGDGSTHPLSGIALFQGQNTTGWTLGQWQAIFPAATATSNELDWCAIQLAINVLNGGGSGTGGLIYIPEGVYRLNQTITLPVVTNSGGPTLDGSVSVKGAGPQSTILRWSADLGSGQFAVLCANRLTSSVSVGDFTDICIVGPNASVAVNVKPANMHGFGWAQWMRAERVRIIGFNGGFCVPGGEQTRICNVDTWNCYYGIYYDDVNSPLNVGDMVYERCTTNLSKKAGLGIGPNSEVVGVVFIKCFFGTAPYGIFKETGGTDDIALQEVKFIHTQFEGFGNAVISDGLAAGSHVASISGNVQFDFCQFQPDATYNIAAASKTAYFAIMHSFGHLLVTAITSIGNLDFTGFTNGFFEVDFFNCITLEADLDTMFGLLSGIPIGKASSFNIGSFRLRNIGVFGWEGTVYPANGNPTLIIGSVLACDSSGAGFVGLSAGNATELILGICALPQTASGGLVCVIQRGYAPVVKAGTNVITNGAWARAATGGVAITSTGIAQTTSRNLGVWGNGSGSSPNLFGSIFLQGLV